MQKQTFWQKLMVLTTTQLLTKEQKDVITRGRKQGLHRDQISIYANPEFSVKQMEEILCGFETGLTKGQVAFYAKAQYDDTQMMVMRFGFNHAVPQQQMEKYLNPDKYTGEQMFEIKLGLDNLSSQQLDIYAKPEYNHKQIYQLRKGLERNIDVSTYENTGYDNEEMHEIRMGLERNTNPVISTDSSSTKEPIECSQSIYEGSEYLEPAPCVWEIKM